MGYYDYLNIVVIMREVLKLDCIKKNTETIYTLQPHADLLQSSWEEESFNPSQDRSDKN